MIGTVAVRVRARQTVTATVTAAAVTLTTMTKKRREMAKKIVRAVLISAAASFSIAAVTQIVSWRVALISMPIGTVIIFARSLRR